MIVSDLVCGDESQVTFLLLGIEQNENFDVAVLGSTGEVDAASITVLVGALESGEPG